MRLMVLGAPWRGLLLLRLQEMKGVLMHLVVLGAP